MLLKTDIKTIIKDDFNPDDLIIKVSDYMLPYAHKKTNTNDDCVFSESLDELDVIVL